MKTKHVVERLLIHRHYIENKRTKITLNTLMNDHWSYKYKLKETNKVITNPLNELMRNNVKINENDLETNWDEYLTNKINKRILDIAAMDNKIKRKDKKAEIKIATFGTALNYFKDKYDTIPIKGQKFPDSSFKLRITFFIFQNLLQPFFVIKNIIKLRKLVKKFNPDVIISDTQPESLFLGRKIITIYNMDLEKLDFKKTLMMKNHEKIINCSYY